MTTLQATFDFLRRIKSTAAVKTGRHFDGFFADRIVQAASEPTLLAAMERLAKTVDAQVEYIGGAKTAAFLAAAHADDASAVLAWIRSHPKVVAMVAGLKNEEDYREAIAAIEVAPLSTADDSVISEQPSYDVLIGVQCLAPLAHGAEGKAGNATLFRRRQAITSTGRVMELPFYGGNALRGQLRDLLADHLLEALGLIPRRHRPPLSIWFFHCLYAGGVLEEGGAASKAVDAELGRAGALRTDGLRRLRDHLPSLSLLGTAIGNRVLPGRICVGDLRPKCREWGTGELPATELMEWTYLTRRDDFEGRGDEDAHAGMIATTECLKSGTMLMGGIDIDTHASELERAALGRGLALLAEHGWLGAENRRGLGKVKVAYQGAPDPEPYDVWLADHRDEVLAYLNALGALHAPRESDRASA